MDELRSAAEKATPGPWEVYGPWHEGERPGIEAPTPSVVVYGHPEDDAGVQEPADAAYIAAANPSEILRLLDRLDTVEAAARAVLAEAEPDDNFEGEFVDWLVPDEQIAALRAVLDEPKGDAR